MQECRVKPSSLIPYVKSKIQVNSWWYCIKLLPDFRFYPSNIILKFGSHWLSSSCYDFSKTNRSSQLWKWPRQCLPFLSPLRSKYFAFGDLKFYTIQENVLANLQNLPMPVWSLYAYKQTLGKLMRSLGTLFPTP